MTLEKLNQKKRLQKHSTPENTYFHPCAQIFSEGLSRRPALNCWFLKGEDSSFVLLSYSRLYLSQTQNENKHFSFEALTRTAGTKGQLNAGTSIIVVFYDPYCSLQEQHQMHDEWPGRTALGGNLAQEMRQLGPAPGFSTPPPWSQPASASGCRNRCTKEPQRTIKILRWLRTTAVF